MAHNIYEMVLLVQAALLLLTSGLLVYPVVAYARNVAYTEGIVFLALAFFATTVVGVLDFVLDATTAANVARVLGGVFAFAGVWFFARDFVRIGGSSDRFGDFGEHVDAFRGDEDD
jgi:hypothetical protein